MKFNINYLEIISLAFAFEVEHKLSYTYNGWTITAKDETGAPVHLSWGLAVAALENVFAGKEGKIQSGNISIDIAGPGVTPPAMPEEVAVVANEPVVEAAPAPGPMDAPAS